MPLGVKETPKGSGRASSVLQTLAVVLVMRGGSSTAVPWAAFARHCQQEVLLHPTADPPPAPLMPWDELREAFAQATALPVETTGNFQLLGYDTRGSLNLILSFAVTPAGEERRYQLRVADVEEPVERVVLISRPGSECASSLLPTLAVVLPMCSGHSRAALRAEWARLCQPDDPPADPSSAVLKPFDELRVALAQTVALRVWPTGTFKMMGYDGIGSLNLILSFPVTLGGEERQYHLRVPETEYSVVSTACGHSTYPRDRSRSRSPR